MASWIDFAMRDPSAPSAPKRPRLTAVSQRSTGFKIIQYNPTCLKRKAPRTCMSPPPPTETEAFDGDDRPPQQPLPARPRLERIPSSRLPDPYR